MPKHARHDQPVAGNCFYLGRSRKQRGSFDAWDGNLFFFANIFVPYIRVSTNVVRQQCDALFGIEIDNPDPKRAEPFQATLKIAAFTNQYRAKAKLTNQPAAIPAGSKCSDHDETAIAALASGIPKGVRFTMDRRIPTLHTAVVAGADQPAASIENRRPHGDTAFGQPLARFGDGDREHGCVIGF